MKIFFSLLATTLFWSCLQGQGFKVTSTKKMVTLTEITGTNLEAKFKFKNRHSSVLIAVYRTNTSIPETHPIGSDSTLEISTDQIAKVTIIHKKKFVFRYCQKLKIEEGDKRRLNPGRTKVSSGSSGNTTSTTIEAT